jgi:adenylate cyclase class 2
MEPLEIEVKFYLPDLFRIRERVLSLAPIRRCRQHEINVRFDDAADRLRHRSALLRLRRDDRIRLTFKSPPPQPDDQFKVHRELETEIGNFEVMTQILTALGYRQKQIYEKWRETFVLGRCHLCLDQMPYGDFLEIEGPAEEIRPTAERLGLEWKNRIVSNYLEIFEAIRQSLGLSFQDLTFDNFRNLDDSFEPQIERLRVNDESL